MKLSIGRKTVGKGVIFLFANILNAAIPFLLLPVLTRVLSPEDYGTVAIFAIFLSFTNAFVGLSVHGAINVQFFKLEIERFSEYVTNCLLLLVVSALVMFLSVLVLGEFFVGLLDLPKKWMLIAVVASFFQFLITIRLTIWVVTGSAIEYGALQVSQSFFNAALSLVFIFCVGLFWEGRLLGQIIAISVFGSLAFYLIKRSGYIVKPKNTMADFKNALLFGVPLIPHTIGGFLMYGTDRFIISNLIDVAAVGVYMVGLQLGQVMGLVSDSFNKVYAPWIIKNLSDQELDKVQLVKRSYLAMAVFLLGGLCWGGVVIFSLPLLVGEEFSSAKSVIIYMCVGHSFTALYYMVVNYIFYTERTKLLALTTFLSATLNVPITYFMVKLFGLEGAAMAFLLVQILFFLLVWLLSNRAYPMPWLFFLKGVKNA